MKSVYPMTNNLEKQIVLQLQCQQLLCPSFIFVPCVNLFQHLTLILYVPPVCCSASYQTTSAVAIISMLSSYSFLLCWYCSPTMSPSYLGYAFLFQLACSYLCCLPSYTFHTIPPFLLAHVSQFLSYPYKLFCYRVITLLHISQPIPTMLTHLITI